MGFITEFIDISQNETDAIEIQGFVQVCPSLKMVSRLLVVFSANGTRSSQKIFLV